jgi:hypothetical protein
MTARTSSKGNIASLREKQLLDDQQSVEALQLQHSLGIGRDNGSNGPPRNPSDDQNFRSAYYKKIGFHGVEVKLSLEQVMVSVFRMRWWKEWLWMWCGRGCCSLQSNAPQPEREDILVTTIHLSLFTIND